MLHDAGVISANDTAVVIDSTADLPDYADRFANLRMVPLTVRFGDEQDLRDHVDLDADAFYTRLALSSEPPRTSAPAPQAFADCYAELLAGPYRHVVSVHISGKLSATVQSARLAAETHGGAVTVIDAGSASAGTALCALGVEALLAKGTTVEEVVAYGERFARTAPLPVQRRDRSTTCSAAGASAGRRRSSAACSASARSSAWSTERSWRSRASGAPRAC